MHNLEYKAELRDPDLARSVCGVLGASFIGTLEQTDTYFRVAHGRLKRRECAGEPTEWIFYERPDRTRPKLSHFVIYSEDSARERFGASALPVWVVVRKVRDLYMLGSVRIHLDRVDGLGSFLELEAMVTPSHDLRSCHEVLGRLLEALGPGLGEPIAGGYADMLSQDAESRASAE